MGGGISLHPNLTLGGDLLSELGYSEVFATSDDINEIIDAVEPTINNFPVPFTIMALLSICIALMKPTVSEREVVDGVAGASQWICEFLKSTESVPKNLMN